MTVVNGHCLNLPYTSGMHDEETWFNPCPPPNASILIPSQIVTFYPETVGAGWKLQHGKLGTRQHGDISEQSVSL
jgi:hypothetical protein